MERSTVRRAQMYLVQLRWLEGFAAIEDGELRWWSLDGAAPFVLDGARLAKARRTVNTLRRDCGDVLGDLVGDVERWAARIDAALQLLGARVHRGASGEVSEHVAPRLRRAARALVAAAPALADVVDAAVMAGLTGPDELARTLAWMAPRTAALADLIAHMADAAGVRRTLRLARLAEDGVEGIDALIALALVDAPDPAQARAYVANLVERIGGRGCGPSPVSTTSTPIAVRWIDHVLERVPDERRRALALYAAIEPAGVLAPWRAWWDEHAPRLTRADAFAAQGADRRPGIRHVARVLGGLDAVVRSVPPAVELDGLLIDLDLLARKPLEPFHRALLRLLASLPPPHDTPVARARFVMHAAHIGAGAEDRKPAWLWDAVADQLDAGAPAGLLGLWAPVWRGDDQHWLDDRVLRPLTRQAEVVRFAAALAWCAVGRAVDREVADRAAALIAAGVAPEAAAATVRGLVRLHGGLEVELARAAVALAGGAPDALVARITALDEMFEDLDCCDIRHVGPLIEHVAAAGAGWLIDATLAARRGRALHDAAELAALVPRKAWPRVATAGEAPAWTLAYPPALHGALARLASVDPDAEATAGRRLAADLPSTAALAREAAALRARAPLADRAAARLRTLEARIATPPLPSPVRLSRLADKLEASAATIGLARLTAGLAAKVQAKVVASLGFDERSETMGGGDPAGFAGGAGGNAPRGIDPWPGWQLDHKAWALLIGLGKLDGGTRALAARLLRARTGPPPWDLRDEPANRGFLDRLRARGIDPGPWLDDGPRTVRAEDGQPVELAFTSDPLEVFAMGAHFQTCLSPDGGNYFSVVANAADVNKRVLYARRGGAVVGRCLLALTDAGGLLTFHAYWHAGSRVGFVDLVRDLAIDLAARMGTIVVPRGAVSILLAREWYDDGPQDVVGRFAALASDELTAALEALPLDQVPARLEAALGHRLDDLVLPLVIALPVCHRRPELVRALEPALRAHPTLPDATMFQAAQLALRAGLGDLAERLIDDRGARIDLVDHPWFLGPVLARIRPELALARLRATRARGVRGWADDRGDRVAVAAVAMEALHRPRQAAELYRMAIQDAPFLREELTPRLAALEAVE